MTNDMVPGQRYGKLTVMAPAGILNNYKAYRFRCDCGVEKVFAGSLVRNGRQRSCGCLRQIQKRTFKQQRLNLLKSRRKAAPSAEVLSARLELLSNIFHAAGKSF